MPYINEQARNAIDDCDVQALTPGELNYVITRECTDYLAWKGVNYETLNSVIGVLECAKLEMYRRMIAPYEDKKIEENGDVYP